MLKDIEFKKSEQIAIAVVPESSGEETMWTVYFLNLGPQKVENVLITSRGYGEINGKEVKTATLRWFLGDIEPEEACKVEEIPEDVSLLNNEFWVSYYIGKVIYDKKYVFVLDSLQAMHLTDVPILASKGILIR